VWLPPQYDGDDDDRRFPVLYCHDGQNALEDASSWTGASWRIAGALTRLSDAGLLSGDASLPPVVVLVPSSDGDFPLPLPVLPMGAARRRHLEYGGTSSAIAQAHADFVAATVKPLVDSAFRTLTTSPRDAYAVGSSLGGQASLNLLLRHPDKFGGAAMLSPAFGPDTLADVFRAAAAQNAEGGGRILEGKRVYMDIGGDDGDSKVPWIDVGDHLTRQHWWNPGYWWLDTSLRPGFEAMRAALLLAGADLESRVVPGERHNERAWSRRIHLPLLHLYGK